MAESAQTVKGGVVNNSLRLRSLTVVSDSEVDIVFESDDGSTVTHRFTVEEAGPVLVTNGDRGFNERYRRVPGPITPVWPEQLAAAAWRARREPLPAGRALADLAGETDAKLTQAWAERENPSDQFGRLTR
jgi:hypothetical protein